MFYSVGSPLCGLLWNHETWIRASWSHHHPFLCVPAIVSSFVENKRGRGCQKKKENLLSVLETKACQPALTEIQYNKTDGGEGNNWRG